MFEVLTGAGLAAAAGLNAYIPLLAIGLLSRFTDLVSLPPGCAFAPRCPSAFDRCREAPPVRTFGDQRTVRCWLATAGSVSADTGARKGAA